MDFDHPKHTVDLYMERDAARYRWLLAKMQEAYDSGHQVEFNGNLFIDVSMPFRRKDHRRISAAISFSDVSDEPLGLSVAIDEAMK